MKDNFLGIWKTRQGLFVKVTKSGLIEVPPGRNIDGFIGYEIGLDGKRKGDYLFWNDKGLARIREWDLMERKTSAGEFISGKFENWPIDLKAE